MNIIPFFEDTSSSYISPLETCHCCSKFISQSRHTVIGCSICESVVHADCANEYTCNSCCSENGGSLSSPHFNLFTPEVVNDYQLFDHEFELDDHLETLSTASYILDQCDYIDLSLFDNEFNMEDPESFISFYFLNINGLKTNFDEFVLNHQSIANSFDIICLAETNVDSCDINTNRYQLSSDYLCLDIPKLPDKQKGSGLALAWLSITANHSNLVWLKSCVIMVRTVGFKYLVVNLKRQRDFYTFLLFIAFMHVLYRISAQN